MQNDSNVVRNDAKARATVKLVMEYTCDHRSREPVLFMTLPMYSTILCIALTACQTGLCLTDLGLICCDLGR
jgi:hypothetical protein